MYYSSLLILLIANIVARDTKGLKTNKIKVLDPREFHSLLPSVQGEVIVGELRLPGNHEIGERPRLAGIYEATLVPMCNLVSQIPSEAFHTLELLLLKHLLSGRFWSSLLSSDVWYFIGRC